MMAEFVRKLAIRAPLALVFATSMAVAEPAVAQTAAAIVGQVVDQSGATLPGVTVTATSFLILSSTELSWLKVFWK